MSSSGLDGVKWDEAELPATMPRVLLEGVNIAMLIVFAIIFITRIAVRMAQRKPYELHDFFCHAAFVFYVAMWIIYWEENDPLWRVERVQRGESPIYAEILHDAGMIYRWMTAGQFLFYASLTLVKLSLLALYGRLLDRMPLKYTIIWWTILVFCVLSFIGSSMTTIFVCDDQEAKYNQGMCATQNEQKRAQFSLWFSYAVDVATDLAVMSLPIRLTWSLQLPKAQKLGIFVLFGSGWICILFATLRVVEVGVKNGVPSTPDSKWLQMWTIVETSMAVVISCAPAFAGLIRRQFGTHEVSYNPRGYVKRSTACVKLKSLGRGESNQSKGQDQELWKDGHGSEEALTDLRLQVTVTTIRVQDDLMSARPGTAASAQLPRNLQGS